MSLPLVVVCGSYPGRVVLQEGGLCPVCSTFALALVQDTTTPCICFLPLWCCGGETTTYANCARCGATFGAAYYPLQPAPPSSSAVTASSAAPAQGQGKEEALLPSAGKG